MPIRPFPYLLSIGTDIAKISRFQRILSAGSAEKNLVHLVRRVLTRPERVQFWGRYGTADITQSDKIWLVCQFLAGRFAAKEATQKAVLWRRLSFHDIIIRTPVFGQQMSAVILDRPLAEGAPIEHEVELLRRSEASGTLKDNASKFRGLFELVHEKPDNRASAQEYSDDESSLSGSIAKISISHDGNYATAVCLAAEEPSSGDVGGEAGARGFDTGSVGPAGLK